MSDYLNNYFQRVFQHGNSIQERVMADEKRNFDRMLQESINRIAFTCGELSGYGVLLTNQYKKNKIVNTFLVPLESPLTIGNVFFNGDDPWLIYKKEEKVNKSHITFEVIKCNYKIRWVDNDGIARESWTYLVSSMEDQVKQNFRTWNDMITPQENKYMEFIMPYTSTLTRNTRLIINDEGWFVIEIDKTSIGGVMYVSLVEAKVNEIDDNLTDSLASADELRQIVLEIPGDFSIALDESFTPYCELYISGKSSDDPVSITLNGSSLAANGSNYSGVELGTSSLTYSYGNVSTIQNVTVVEAAAVDSFLISGSPFIKLDRDSTYDLVSSLNIPITSIACSINNSALAAITNVANSSCIIHANDNNLLGTILLTIEYDNNSYTKSIDIKPLW